MLDRKGRIIVISSVSGGGKTTIISRLKERYPEIRSAVTATTRSPRPGEVNGKDYFFYSKEEFESMVEKDGFVEHAFVHGNYYGVPAGPLNAKLDAGTSVILNIDVQGMESVVRLFQDRVVSIFIKPPDTETWLQRLRSRGSDPEEAIRLRIENGKQEMEKADRFRYTIVNDDLERAVNEIIEILKAEGVIRNGGSESHGG